MGRGEDLSSIPKLQPYFDGTADLQKHQHQFNFEIKAQRIFCGYILIKQKQGEEELFCYNQSREMSWARQEGKHGMKTPSRDRRSRQCMPRQEIQEPRRGNWNWFCENHMEWEIPALNAILWQSTASFSTEDIYAAVRRDCGLRLDSVWPCLQDSVARCRATKETWGAHPAARDPRGGCENTPVLSGGRWLCRLTKILHACCVLHSGNSASPGSFLSPPLNAHRLRKEPIDVVAYGFGNLESQRL